MLPNPFRKLKELWSGTGAQVTPIANDGSRAQEAPTANDEPRAQSQESSAVTHQAYRDAHNLPTLPTRYARPASSDSGANANVFGDSAPSTIFPSQHSFFTAQRVPPTLNNTDAPHCRLNNIPAPQISLFGAAARRSPCEQWRDSKPQCDPSLPFHASIDATRGAGYHAVINRDPREHYQERYCRR
jgi:hypothetical protein